MIRHITLKSVLSFQGVLIPDTMSKHRIGATSKR